LLSLAAFLALYFSGQLFSVSAAIGFISLLGVAVMDGILNITYYHDLRIRGMPVAEAVFRGAEQRMRPLLMTALSAGVGLLPAALSHGIGSQVQRPLATVRRRRHDDWPFYAADRRACASHAIFETRRHNRE
jgi:heavy metal efflux system protein